MLARMPAITFAEWMAFAKIEPFGEERADLRMGIIAAKLHNMWRGKNDPIAKPEDFMPKFEEDEPPSREEVAMKMDAIMSALAARK